MSSWSWSLFVVSAAMEKREKLASVYKASLALAAFFYHAAAPHSAALYIAARAFAAALHRLLHPKPCMASQRTVTSKTEVGGCLLAKEKMSLLPVNDHNMQGLVLKT